MVNSPIDEIKERLDIVELIGSYVKLQKAGINYRALCPFHSEKTPSFFVSPARQLWHCFGGCSEGGDIFKFIMRIEGVEFGDALRLLAQRAGVQLKKEDPNIRSERERLYEICEIATKFFEKQLRESKIGKEAEQYLLGRKINEDSIKKWRIGYAPDTWQGLSDFLSSRDYSKEEIQKAGLGIYSEKGSPYDRFRGRIIFPIFDLNSKVVGFTGRVFVDKNKDDVVEEDKSSSSPFATARVAKYVNTPQTLLYDKGRILYGLDRAKTEIRKKNVCILVEGNTDLIMVHQAGFENAVAVSGTALTLYQLNILKRYSDNLLIAFDMDAAGEMAAKRGIDLAQSRDFNIKVIVLSEGKDPAEIIAKNPNKWKEAVDQAKTILDFYFESAFAKKDLKNPETKKEIAKILLPVIKKIPNKIEQSHWIQKLAEGLKVKEVDIEEELKKTSIIDSFPTTTATDQVITKVSQNRKEIIEQRILSLISQSPEQVKILNQKTISLFSNSTQDVLINIKEKKHFKLSTRAIAKGEEEDLSSSTTVFNSLIFKTETIEETEEKNISLEIQSCLKEIELLDIRDKLEKTAENIKRAEEEKDFQKSEKLIQEFNKFSKLFFNLKD